MLVPNQYEINLGKLSLGQTYKFNYELTNTSAEEDLTVEKLILGCFSCTKAKINNPFIKPGAKATVDVEFTPGATGINLKQITVQYSTNKMKGNFPLKFRAIVS